MTTKLYLKKCVFLNGIKNLKLVKEALKMLHIQDGSPHKQTEVNCNTTDAMLQEDRWLTIAKIADIIHISYGSV